MAADGWTVVSLDDMPTLDTDDLPAWKPVRHSLGIEAFGMNAWLGPEAGVEVIDDHDELEDGGQEELYYVVSGRATFTVGGDRVEAPAGTFIALRDPALRRAAVAEEAGTLIIAVGGFRGAGFKPSAWELERLAKL
jgi:hypothetical protein